MQKVYGTAKTFTSSVVQFAVEAFGELDSSSVYVFAVPYGAANMQKFTCNEFAYMYRWLAGNLRLWSVMSNRSSQHVDNAGHIEAGKI